MIKTERGFTSISGSTVELQTDLAVIIKGLYDAFTEDYGKKKARAMIDMCFEGAFKTEEELKKEVEKVDDEYADESLEELLEMALKKMREDK